MRRPNAPAPVPAPETSRRLGRAESVRGGAASGRRKGAFPQERPVSIRVENCLSPDSLALIEESQAALLQHLPPEEIFSLSAEELAAPNVTFFVARLEGAAMGCVALLDGTAYGEVKRLFVRQPARGLGLGRAMMETVEQYCRDIGLVEIKLETSPALSEAAALYHSMGYVPCARFGDYPLLESSLFMEKDLRSVRAVGASGHGLRFGRPTASP